LKEDVMDIVMLQTIPDESINDGRTKQTFVQGGCYPVPDPIGQLWIGRGWARAAGPKAAHAMAAPAVPAARKGKE